MFHRSNLGQVKEDLNQSELFQAPNLSSCHADWDESMRRMADQLEEEEGENGRGKEGKSANHLRQNFKNDGHLKE